MGIKVKREATKERKNALGRKVVVNRNASGNEAVSKTRTVYSKNGGMVSTKTSYKDRGSMAGKALEKKVDKQMKMPTRVGVIQGKKAIKGGVSDIRKTYGDIAKKGGDITNASSPEGRAFKKAAMEGAKMGATKTSLATKRGMNNAIKRNASLNASEEMAQLGSQVSQSAARGAMNSGKVVQRVKQDSKPIMRKAVKEGPVRPIGKTVKRIEMGSKPIMEKRVKEGPVRRIAEDSAKKYNQEAIKKLVNKYPSYKSKP
jgi:hypothetical protein